MTETGILYPINRNEATEGMRHILRKEDLTMDEFKRLYDLWLDIEARLLREKYFLK